MNNLGRVKKMGRYGTKEEEMRGKRERRNGRETIMKGKGK